MTKTIWKFPLKIVNDQVIEVPQGAVILTAQAQHDVACLWAVVESDRPTVGRHIYIRGTGHEIADAQDGDYVGSVQLLGGGLVYHIFAGKAER